jgi:hypothetical protein
MVAGDLVCKPGDNRSTNYCHMQDVANLLGPATAFMPLGDLAYDSGSDASFAVYDSIFGKYKAKTFPVIGNHEYLTSGATGYFKYFGDKATPRQPGCRSSCQGYYSFNLGDWHIVALNTNCSKAGGCGASDPQGQWLKADLAANTKPCIAAAWHHPRYGSGEHYYPGSTGPAALWQILMDYNADVVLSGHEHNYERVNKMNATGGIDTVNGIRSFVVGTGGKNKTPFVSTPIAGSQARNAEAFGVLRLILHPTSFDWKFVPEAGETWTDSGTQSCLN